MPFKLPIIGGILFFLLIVIIIVVFAGGVISEEKGSGSCSDDAYSGSASVKGSSGAWTQKGTKAYNTAKTVFHRLIKDLGISGAAAAGVLGNIRQESGPELSTAINNSSGDGGHGLMQWTFGRRTALTAFAKKQHLREDTLELQIRMIEHDMKNNALWLSGKYGQQSLKQFGHLTDPKEAAMRFYISGMETGAGLRSDPDGSGKNRAAYAEQAYRMFNGSKYKAKSILGGSSKGASSASSDQSGDNTCDDDDAIGTGGPLLSQAKKLIGYFTYGAHGVSGYGSWKHPNKNGQTDCSGFVWLAMKRAGYDVGNDAFFTGTMEADAKGPHKYLKQIKAKDAKPGDVIIMNIGSGVGPNGHTAIIAGKYKGYQTKIIEMGGDNHDHVHTSNIEYSFYSLIHGGARVTWARPVKKK